MEKSIVSVRIYGQEYTISGDKSREYIIKVADYVDQNMHTIARSFGSDSVAALAVLASVNIADEYFETAASLAAREEKCAQQEKDLEHYIQLWEEAKRNFVQLKEETAKLSEQRDQMREMIERKERETAELTARLEKEAASAAAGRDEKLSATERQLAEAQQQIKEAESNFFDLQMENIRLKSEIERFKRTQNNF